jgi:hypothetical protein
MVKHWMLGFGVAGAVASMVMVLLIHLSITRYTQFLLFRSAGLPAEIAYWATNAIFGNEHIAPTQAASLTYDAILVVFSGLQWAIVGGIVAWLYNLVRSRREKAVKIR